MQASKEARDLPPCMENSSGQNRHRPWHLSSCGVFHGVLPAPSGCRVAEPSMRQQPVQLGGAGSQDLVSPVMDTVASPCRRFQSACKEVGWSEDVPGHGARGSGTSGQKRVLRASHSQVHGVPSTKEKLAL